MAEKSKSGVQNALESITCVRETIDREGSALEIHVEPDTTLESFAEVMATMPALLYPTRIERGDDVVIVHCLQCKEIR